MTETKSPAAKAYVALRVTDLGRSLDFYRKLFGAEPVKLRPAYAKFDLAQPALNFTLNESPADAANAPGALSHLGIQVASTGEVLAIRERWKRAGLDTRDEMKTQCCYALQDKTWARDPDGNEWEVFAVLEDHLPEKAAQSDACCAPSCCTPAAARTPTPPMARHYNVLFLCTGNSARSILAEAILNRKGAPHFKAFSAGSLPAGLVRPEALRQLALARLPIDGLRSKSWDEFAAPGAPRMDFVFTVCDKAAKEVCPLWPGQPMTAHWGVPDPAAVGGSPEEIEQAFRDAFITLDRRIGLFLCLPLSSLDQLAIRKSIDDIGKR